MRRLIKGQEVSSRKICAFLEQVQEREVPVRGQKEITSLAIVVPCYGHAAFLPTALASIASQTRLPDEVIAVDDHSPDMTGSILNEHFARFREQMGIRCTLLTNERNRGQAYSLNRGIAAAESELVMVLNDDDYLMHDAVAAMLGFFEQYGEIAMVGGASIHFCGDEELATLPKTGRSSAAGEKVPLSIRMPAEVGNYRQYNDLNMTHSGCCFLMSAWETVGGYFPDKRERIVPFSDRDFQLRINALFPVGLSTQVPFSFWRSGSSVDQGRDS